MLIRVVIDVKSCQDCQGACKCLWTFDGHLSFTPEAMVKKLDPLALPTPSAELTKILDLPGISHASSHEIVMIAVASLEKSPL